MAGFPGVVMVNERLPAHLPNFHTWYSFVKIFPYR